MRDYWLIFRIRVKVDTSKKFFFFLTIMIIGAQLWVEWILSVRRKLTSREKRKDWTFSTGFTLSSRTFMKKLFGPKLISEEIEMLTSLDISEVNTVWTWGGQTSPQPISKYFNNKGGPSGIRTHDLPHDGYGRYPLRHKSLDKATHGIFLILS